MKISAISRSAMLAGFMLVVAMLIGYQLRSTRALLASTVAELGELGRQAAKAEIERNASITLLGAMTLEGLPLVDDREGTVVRWEPAKEGTSFVVFVTPSCPYSLDLLRTLLREAATRNTPTGIVVASLAGDAQSLQNWREQLRSDVAIVTFMIHPRSGGRRIAVDAVPMVFHYVDATLVEVHAGREWPPELDNAKE